MAVFKFNLRISEQIDLLTRNGYTVKRVRDILLDLGIDIPKLKKTNSYKVSQWEWDRYIRKIFNARYSFKGDREKEYLYWKISEWANYGLKGEIDKILLSNNGCYIFTSTILDIPLSGVSWRDLVDLWENSVKIEDEIPTFFFMYEMDSVVRKLIYTIIKAK